MLKRTDIVYINHFDDACKIFGNTIDIKGGVNYFLKDTHHNGDCKFNGSITKLNKYDVFVDGKFHAIIDKLVMFDSIITLYLGRYFGIESNDKRLKGDKTIDTVKCYVSQQKGFEKYIDIKDIKKEYKFWKVITAEAAYEHKSGFGNTFIGNIDEVHTGSYISFKVSNENEGKSLLSYMKCRLPNFMLSLRKSSQHNNEDVCKWIPLPPLNKEWTDDEVYQHFKLSEEDIKLINDTNIVGYKSIVKQTEGSVETPEPKPKRVSKKKIQVQ
jgi:site-specific DNA-methyltransferase (adenine-specific)